MKKLITIMQTILAIGAAVVAAQAQQVQTEVLSIVSIGAVSQTNNTTVEFDLTMKRTTTLWERWANGTFQLKIEGVADERYATDRMRVELLPGTSALTLQSFQANGMDTGYVITPRVFPGRISITIFGPDSFSVAKFFPQDSTIRLGRFRISALDSIRLNSNLTWAAPLDYYQANAYKLDVDSMKAGVKWYGVHDNVEMRNFPRILGSGTTTVRKDSFYVAPPPQACLELIAADSAFTAFYLGDKMVNLKWYTKCEQGVQGYILRRRAIDCPGMKPSDLEFHEIRRFGNPYDSALYSKGNTVTGYAYKPSTPDTVNYRDVVFEYELSALFYDGTRRYIDTTRVYIPNSIITEAYVGPNPLVVDGGGAASKPVKIWYRVEDRVRLTVKVYDVVGKELATIKDKEIEERTPVNPNRTEDNKTEQLPYIEWSVPDQASQGLYNVILIAYPVDDTSVELSRAIVKLQVMR